MAYVFRVTTVDRIPPRIGPGGDRDPIYPPASGKAFAACIRYYTEAERFLNGERRTPPTIRPALKLCVPHSSIFKAEIGEPDKYGEKLLIWIEDKDIPSEARKVGPRWFPPEYFPAAIMLTSPGGSLRHNYSRKNDASGSLLPRNKRKSYLSFGREANQNIRLLRILSDAKPGTQMHRISARSFSDNHREYRPEALLARCDYDAGAMHGRAGYSQKGRKAAFRAAVQHWDAPSKLHPRRKLPDDKLTGEDLYRLLVWAFDIADRLYRANNKKMDA